MHDLGVQDKVIEKILRHEEVAATQRHYVVVDSKKAEAAMAAFAVALGNKWATHKPAKRRKSLIVQTKPR